jgi:hypothetical protein
MPKNLTPAMRAHLDAETTRLAVIWRITRNGQQFFFTDHDRDIVFGGEVYRADAGFARTAILGDGDIGCHPAGHRVGAVGELARDDQLLELAGRRRHRAEALAELDHGRARAWLVSNLTAIKTRHINSNRKETIDGLFCCNRPRLGGRHRQRHDDCAEPDGQSSYDRKLWTGREVKAAYPSDEQSPLR